MAATRLYQGIYTLLVVCNMIILARGVDLPYVTRLVKLTYLHSAVRQGAVVSETPVDGSASEVVPAQEHPGFEKPLLEEYSCWSKKWNWQNCCILELSCQQRCGVLVECSGVLSIFCEGQVVAERESARKS
ncbi:hypothetical protein POM88_039758 [Heracleum sosnowskyi]|uniref:Uncharacterized protein n=1 Tax=Heracleum sosnowskyi TaxID=360622 RepID=A0AAD8HDP6_9APIA|nr:hypothetical protein POM88_039758 [Heracleum sosnowskyi]